MVSHALATLGILLAAGLGARSIAGLVKVPEILVLVLVGVILGPHVTSAIDVPSDSTGAQLVFTLGVSAILFYGGLNLSLRVLRQVASSLAMLVIPGVVITTVIVGAAAHAVFDLDWRMSFLLGAVLSPTDPAILIPMFIGTRLRPKVMQTVIAESAFNDPTGAVLALSLASSVLAGGGSLSAPALDFIREVAESAGVGVVAGILLSAVVSSRRFGIWRDSAAIASLAMVTIAYVSLDTSGGSGYLGAFLAGLIVGNMDLFRLSMHDHQSRELRTFAGEMADIVTLLVFLVLGANLPLGALADRLPECAFVVGALLVVARPIAVLVCTLPDRRACWSRSELIFLCWTRETGVVPAALVGILAARGVPSPEVFSSVVTLAVLGTLVAQAVPARRLAGRLRLIDVEPPMVPSPVPASV